MTNTTDRVRAHYDGSALFDRIKALLPAPGAQSPRLAVSELASLDQFHMGGLETTAELAGSLALQPGHSVLDLGCGIGGPARYLATTFGCKVAGVDLSPSFIETAEYLTSRCEHSAQVEFLTGDALDLAVQAACFDNVMLQHVARNIDNRAALYR